MPTCSFKPDDLSAKFKTELNTVAVRSRIISSWNRGVKSQSRDDYVCDSSVFVLPCVGSDLVTSAPPPPAAESYKMSINKIPKPVKREAFTALACRAT
jgi:hypothetical protein